MPNWVFNTLENVPRDVYEKYKSEDYAIDFNKIVPEPEEVRNTPSTSYNETAMNIYKYKEYIKNLDDDYKGHVDTDPNNPLRDTLQNKANRVILASGKLAMKYPDNSLNEILAMEDNKVDKCMYDEYVEIFDNCDTAEDIYNRYIAKEEEAYSAYSKNAIESYETIEDFGKHLAEMEEKYGYTNWYDWRHANWGTKWNSSDGDYDEEHDILTFNTAWSIPYPIIAKIAEENPELKIDGYSEEENGWFDKYKIEDGMVTITSTGDIEYDEDSEQTEIKEEEIENPKPFNYAMIVEETKKDWDDFLKCANTLSNNF